MTFRDDLEDLPEALAQLPHPGLRFGSALHKVEISAFDNQPPEVVAIDQTGNKTVTHRDIGN